MYYISISNFYSYDGSETKMLFFETEGKTKLEMALLEDATVRYFNDYLQEKHGVAFEGEELSNEVFSIVSTRLENGFSVVYIEEGQTEEVLVTYGEVELNK